MRTRMLPLLVGLVAMLPLTASASPDNGYLGVRMQSIEGGLAEALNLEDSAGVLLGQVVEGSPAEDAGLESGDIVVSIDGTPVGSPNALHEIVRGHEPGDEIVLAYLRDGEEQKTTVKLGEQLRRGPRNYKRVHDLRIGRDRGFLGVVTQPLSGDLGAFFGVEDGEGALVAEVVEESPAAKLGLKAGDVVTRIDGRAVSDPDALRRIVSDFEHATEVEVVWMRDRREKSGKATLEIREGHRAFGLHGFPREFEVRRYVDDGMQWFHDEGVQEKIDEAVSILREELDDIRAELEEIRSEAGAD